MTDKLTAQELEQRACPKCNATASVVGSCGGIDLVRCKECGFDDVCLRPGTIVGVYSEEHGLLGMEKN